MSALELVRGLGTSPSLAPMFALVETFSDKSPITPTIGLLLSAAVAAFVAGGLWRKTTSAVTDVTKAVAKINEAVGALDKKIDKIEEDQRTWQQQNYQPLRDQVRDLARDLKHMRDDRHKLTADRPRSRSHQKSGPG